MNLNLCRLCYEEEATINIFENDELPSLQVKIKLCCGGELDVEQNDGLPSCICRGCLLELNDCYRFVQVCKAADKTMRSLISERNHSQAHMETNESDMEQDSVSPEPTSKIKIIEEDVEPVAKHGVHGPSNRNIAAYLDRVRSPVRSMFTTNKEMNKLICTACNMEFQLWTKLALHLSTHSTSEIHQCLFCDSMFDKSSYYTTHITRSHFKDPKKYICEICGYGCFTNHIYEKHMQSHSSERPYTCDICSKSFKTKHTLHFHKRRHIGKKSFICTVCGKAFWNNYHLKSHSIVHQNAKPFECQICHSRYKHEHNRDTHMKVHLQPGQYVCHHCERAYTHRFDLVRHIRSKHS